LKPAHALPRLGYRIARYSDFWILGHTTLASRKSRDRVVCGSSGDNLGACADWIEQRLQIARAVFCDEQESSFLTADDFTQDRGISIWRWRALHQYQDLTQAVVSLNSELARDIIQLQLRMSQSRFVRHRESWRKTTMASPEEQRTSGRSRPPPAGSLA
jgi:hypothetical protein